MSLINRDYRELIEGKAVTLIGGGPDITSVDYDTLIVRCNTNYLASIQPADILYLSSADNIGQLEANLDQDRLKYVWINMNAGNCQLYSNLCIRYGVPYDYYVRYARETYRTRNSWYAQFQGKYEFLPLTGVLAMYHIMQYNPASLYVTGMDLYITKDNRLHRQVNEFDIRKQAEAIKGLAKEYGEKLKIDTRLNYILTYLNSLMYNG